MSAARLNVVDGWSQLDCDTTEVVPVESSAAVADDSTANVG